MPSFASCCSADDPKAGRSYNGGMMPVHRLLMILGGLLLAAGLLVWLAGRLGFRGLPGDIHYESRNVAFHFPIVTCLLFSTLLTLAIWLWRWFQER